MITTRAIAEQCVKLYESEEHGNVEIIKNFSLIRDDNGLWVNASERCYLIEKVEIKSDFLTLMVSGIRGYTFKIEG